MLNILRSKVDDFRASRVKSSSANRKALAAIPASLYPYWKRTAHFEFKGIPQDAFFFGAPSMGALLWVKVPPRADHSERSEAQLHKGNRVWEGSVEHKS